MFKDFVGINNDYWRQIFKNADFSSSFQFIKDLNLFPTYSRVFTDPYKDLKMFSLKDLSQIQENVFDYDFFIPKKDIEDASIDTIFDEDSDKFAKIRPPLFEDLLQKDQIYINGSKRVSFSNVNSLFEDFKRIDI